MTERTRAWKLGDTVTCYEITNAGEGGRGRSVELMGYPRSGEWVAQQAAEYFDEIEKRKQDLSDSDLDGGRQVIEVVGLYDVPVRYRVRCEVVRKYEANEDEGPL